MRRFLALLLSVAMLHLTVVGGDVACATHGHEGAAAPAGTDHAAMGETMDMSHAAPHGDAMADGESWSHCATPVRANCCDAMSSCGVTIALDADVRVDAPVVTASRAEREGAIRLVSFAAAPEPPPPKA